MRRRITVLVAAVAAVALSGVALAAVGAVTFDGTAPLSLNDTVATVTVTAVCGSPTQTDPGQAFAEILQPSGRLLAIGSGSSTFTCDGSTQSVDVLVPSTTGPYKKGWATALVEVSYFDTNTSTFEFKDASSPIKLTR
jgi:hypothetical protein